MDKYICSDSDCAQYYRRINDYTFVFIEIRELFTEEYIACSSTIDIRGYGLDELWDYCSCYYPSFEDMVAEYGLRETLHIIAECIFEQLDFSEMELSLRFETWDDAEAFVKEQIGYY